MTNMYLNPLDSDSVFKSVEMFSNGLLPQYWKLWNLVFRLILIYKLHILSENLLLIDKNLAKRSVSLNDLPFFVSHNGQVRYGCQVKVHGQQELGLQFCLLEINNIILHWEMIWIKFVCSDCNIAFIAKDRQIGVRSLNLRPFPFFNK